MPTALSAHFTLDELIVSQEAARAGIDNTPPAEVRRNLEQLAQALEDVRSLLDNKAVLVTSGYRCRELNARIGGSAASAHVEGRAADLIAPAFGTPFDVSQRIAASDLAFDQLIHEFGRWVHVSIPREGQAGRRELLSIFRKGTYLAGLVRDGSGVA